jgi:hypothetical protein
LCPTVALLGDSPVFTSAAIEWGVPQPSGYPLFTAIGHVFAQLPFGDSAWRVHLTSAVFHAAAVGVMADALRRATGSIAAAAAGALFLAFSRLFFLGSLYAEAFPLNDLLTTVAVASALALDRAHATRASALAQWRRLVAFTVVAGVASTHHQMIALAAPGLAIVIAPAARAVLRARPARAVPLAGIFTGIVVAGYALIPVAAARDPYTSWGDVSDLSSLVRLVTRQDYGGLLSPALVGDARATSGDRLAVLASATWTSFGALGCALAALGAARLWQASRRVSTGLLVVLLLSGPVFAIANALPIASPRDVAFVERFFTMAHVVVAFWVGLGAAAVERWAIGRGMPRRLVYPAIGLAWVAPFVTNADGADLRRDVIGRAFAHDVVRPVEERGVALVVGDEMVGAAAYACGVERLCDGRAIFSPGQLHMPWRVRQLRRRHPDLVLREDLGRLPRASDVLLDNAGRPSYVTAPLLELDPVLREQFGFLPDGVLLEVMPEARVQASRQTMIDRSRAMLDGDACAGCKTEIARSAATPLDLHVMSTYTTALENHATLLEVLFDAPDESAAIRKRFRELSDAL